VQDEICSVSSTLIKFGSLSGCGVLVVNQHGIGAEEEADGAVELGVCVVAFS
jgi:hypothetical protein